MPDYAVISNNNTKLLVQFVFKVSTFHFNTHTKMRVPQPDSSHA